MNDVERRIARLEQQVAQLFDLLYSGKYPSKSPNKNEEDS